MQDLIEPGGFCLLELNIVFKAVLTFILDMTGSISPELHSKETAFIKSDVFHHYMCGFFRFMHLFVSI